MSPIFYKVILYAVLPIVCILLSIAFWHIFGRLYYLLTIRKQLKKTKISPLNEPPSPELQQDESID